MSNTEELNQACREIAELRKINNTMMGSLNRLCADVSNGEHISKEWIESTIVEHCDDMMKRAYNSKISRLESKLAKAVEHISKLKVEVYCLYKQAANKRLDKSQDFTCIVKRKVTDAEQFLKSLEEIGEQE